jgi:hypothetical protein
MPRQARTTTPVNLEDTETIAFCERLILVIDRIGSVTKTGIAAGVSESAVRSWRDGKSDPQRRMLVKITEAAGVNIGWLANGQGPMLANGEQEDSGGLSSAPKAGSDSDSSLVPRILAARSSYSQLIEALDWNPSRSVEQTIISAMISHGLSDEAAFFLLQFLQKELEK